MLPFGVPNAALNGSICCLKCGPKCCHLLPYLVLVAASICFIWSLKCCPKCFHLVPYYEASWFGPPDGDRYTGPRLGPQVAQCVRVGLAQGGEL